jgi:hypothetical protein
LRLLKTNFHAQWSEFIQFYGKMLVLHSSRGLCRMYRADLPLVVAHQSSHVHAVGFRNPDLDRARFCRAERTRDRLTPPGVILASTPNIRGSPPWYLINMNLHP